MIGPNIIQEYPGDYIKCITERDFPGDKKKLFNTMIGNIDELTAPEKYENRDGFYPNAYVVDSSLGPEPSIRGRKIYVPLNT